MKKIRPAHLRTGWVYVLHDNASPHKTKKVRDYLAEQKVKILPYPLYNPDLAPVMFCYFLC